MTATGANYRFSGHETFPCRYAWLPKAFHAITTNPRTFADEDSAMIALGVGKNMVRAIRFWADVCGVAKPAKGGAYEITQFGQAIFGRKGFDPFLDLLDGEWVDLPLGGGPRAGIPRFLAVSAVAGNR